MAQYYNVVAGSVPLMVEEMQQICEGQGIQLVVEDINNCTNGGQQFLTYTTAPQHHEGGLYPQRAVVGGQLTGVQMDQRQNVYIINTTNDLPVQQSGLKAEVVHANLANDGIVNIVNERGIQYVIAGGKLPLNNIHEVQQQPQQQQQIQWINMPENNINYEGSMKPETPTTKLVTTVRTPQQRTQSSLTLQTQGQCSGTGVSSPQYVVAGPSDKKGPRSYKNKGRGGVTGGGPARQSMLTVDGITPMKNIITPRGKNSPKPHQQQQITQMPLTPPQSLAGDSTTLERTPINPNLINNRTPNNVGNNLGSAYRAKSFGTPGPNATGHSANSRGQQTPTRPAIMSKTPDAIGQMRNTTGTTSQAMKSLPALHYPAMDSLSERIKQAKLQKVMPAVGTNLLSPSVNVPACPTARPPLHPGQTRQNPALIQRPTTTAPTSPALLSQRGNTQIANQTVINEKSQNTQQQQQLNASQVQAQRRQSTKAPQQSLSQDSRNVLEILKKQTSTPCQQKYQREPAMTTTTTTTMTPTSPTTMTTTTTTLITSPSAVIATSNFSDNDERMEIDSVTSECTVESDGMNNHEQHESANEEHDGSSASFAYLQKVIENPQTTIVQKQIAGNTVKMLVVLQNGEQRLITFDIPNEPCTVQDLLEQANISFGEETCVSLVSDKILGINYIVEGGAHMGANCQEGSESGDPYQFQENPITPPDSSSPNFATADENSNSSITPNEEPKFIDGKLAVCPNCGIGSLDFNRCARCKKNMPENVKSILMTTDPQSKKESMISIDNFYKKTNEQNASSKLDAAMGKKRSGRGGRRPAAKTRPVKEPECLTISSDEEDGSGKPRKSDSTMSNVSSSTGGSYTGNDEMDTILDKEPVITNSTTSSTSTERTVDSEGGIKGGGREEHIEDGSIKRPHTSLVCRTVRIGSYKYVPRERIVISQSGVRLAVPLLEDDKSFVNLDVKFDEIVKVLIHFGKMMPVLFFYTSTTAGAMIREVLGMQDPKGPYYDPAGRDHTHKRITLLPEKLSEEAKVILKTLFMPGDVLVEINPKEANDILVRASPKDALQSIQSQSLGGLGRRQSQSTTVTNNNGNGGGIQIMTVYPPPPAKGGIAINTEDYICLGEDQFLNDAIIDFYLRYLMSELLSQSDQNRTHVFSSYFYKRLTSPHTQAGESPVTLTPAARRHARVQKWTKNVNIFEKDFIIIPINEHAHWFLAIICYPGLVGKVCAAPQPPKESSSHKSGQKNKKSKEVKLQALTIGSTTITPVTTTITIDQMDEGSERDEAEGDDEEMEMESDDDDETENPDDEMASPPFSPMTPEVVQRDVKIPCILIFDSLAGASRSRVVATLRDYLSCEHAAKVGTEKVFSKDTIKGSSPKVPQQSNFTDCGLYLLQYVESFFKAPIRSYVLPIRTLKNWFEEIVVTRKREELAKLLVRLMNKTKGEKIISLPVVQFPTHDGKMRPKPEIPAELKTPKIEADIKKKPMQPATQQSATSVDDKTRLVALSTSSVLTTTASENAGEKPELVTRTTTVYQIVPCNSSLNISSGDSPQETLFDAKPSSRTSSGTLSYLRNKRIPRLMTREHDGPENQATSAKKHKGDSNEGATRSMSVGSGSSAGSSVVTNAKPVGVTNYDSCK